MGLSSGTTTIPTKIEGLSSVKNISMSNRSLRIFAILSQTELPPLKIHNVRAGEVDLSTDLKVYKEVLEIIDPSEDNKTLQFITNILNVSQGGEMRFNLKRGKNEVKIN